MNTKNANKNIFATHGKISKLNKDGSKKSRNDILEFVEKNSLTKNKLGNYAKKIFGNRK